VGEASRPPDHRLLARRLTGRGSDPALELLEAPVRGEPDRPQMLCMHGAFGGAWMWEIFLRCMAAKGRQAAAISLRGHGKSEGREHLRDAILADYTADILRAFEEFALPPIVIAHSLGGLLAQRLLGRVRMRALVLLAPLPPEGMLLMSPRLLATAPEIWFEIMDTLIGNEGQALTHAASLIFSRRFAPVDYERHLSRMVPESIRVLIESHLPLPSLPAFALGIPAIVISGDEDRIVTRDSALRTALYHGARHVALAGAGHLPHLEPGAEQMADLVTQWLEERGL
jgi:pimeloyl-ACP methyl ester carboxylesterase